MKIAWIICLLSISIIRFYRYVRFYLETSKCNENEILEQTIDPKAAFKVDKISCVLICNVYIYPIINSSEDC